MTYLRTVFPSSSKNTNIETAKVDERPSEVPTTKGSERVNVGTIHSHYHKIKNCCSFKAYNTWKWFIWISFLWTSQYTSKNQTPDVLVFNRVPRSGSQTMMALLRELSPRNEFYYYTDRNRENETIDLTNNEQVESVFYIFLIDINWFYYDFSH